MNIERISHIGIAVRDLDQQIPFYRDVLGLPFLGLEEVHDQGVRVALFGAGEVRVELLQPTSLQSPIAKFLHRHGEGIHHLAYAVQDLPRALAELESKEVELIDKAPRQGAGGQRIAFLHPRSTGGVLTELCE